MTFSFIATAVLLFFLVVALITRNEFRAVSVFISAFSIAGIYFVWHAEALNKISQFVGIGRGADLLLYMWVLSTMGVILVLFLKLRLLNENLTKLARHIALQEVQKS